METWGLFFCAKNTSTYMERMNNYNRPEGILDNGFRPMRHCS